MCRKRAATPGLQTCGAEEKTGDTAGGGRD